MFARSRCLPLSLVISVCSLCAMAQLPLETTAYVTLSSSAPTTLPSTILPVEMGSISYLEFNSEKALPQMCGKSILRLRVKSVAAPGAFDVFEVVGPWNNDGLTYQKALPLLGASATGNHPVSLTLVDVGRLIDVDITPAVQNWVHKTAPNHGIALVLVGTATSAGSFTFDGIQSQDVTAHPPQILQQEDCESYNNVLPDQFLTCVGPHDDCPDQTKDAVDSWKFLAEEICHSHPCPTEAKPLCTRSSPDPATGKNENADDSACKRKDPAKPKGCYSYAVGNVQCKCVLK